MLVFHNEGEIDLKTITTFGVNVKEGTNPIGHFGTGLKYALAVLLREGQDIKMRVGDREFTFDALPTEIRGQMFDCVEMIEHCDGGVDCTGLGFTTELGKEWEPWMAVREIFCNALDEGGNAIAAGELVGGTTFSLSGDKVDDIQENFGHYFLDPREAANFNCDGFDVSTIESDFVYYRNVIAYKCYKKSNMQYNVHEEQKLTEDRTIAYEWKVRELISRFIHTNADVPFLIKFITHAEGHFEGMIKIDKTQLSEQQLTRLINAYEMVEDKKDIHADARNIHRSFKRGKETVVLSEGGDDSTIDKAIEFLDELGIKIRREDLRFSNDVDELVELDEASGEIFFNYALLEKHPAEICAQLLIAHCMTTFEVAYDNINMPTHMMSAIWNLKK